MGSRMNKPIPAVTSCVEMGSGVRSLNSDSASPPAITIDATQVPTFNKRARSDSMRPGLICLLFTSSPDTGRCRRRQEHLRSQKCHKEDANFMFILVNPLSAGPWRGGLVGSRIESDRPDSEAFRNRPVDARRNRRFAQSKRSRYQR
jgi:hypothetical protein